MSEAARLEFDRLGAQVPTEDLEELDLVCKEMKELGYSGVIGNLCFSVEPKDTDLAGRGVMYAEDDILIIYLSKERRAAIKKVITDNGLSVLSWHFNQTLQPMEEKPEWIFDIHKELLDMAAFAGAKTVTTHFAWMFGEGSPKYMGEFVDKINSGQISRMEYLEEKIRRFGGREKILDDSYVIYDHLCAEAAKRGMSVSIETVPGPLGTGDSAGILKIIDRIGADNLGICIDSGHCNGIDVDTAEAIRIAGDKMIETHFHDNFGVQKNWHLSDMHMPVGIGTINWVDVIGAMREIDYRGSIVFEQSDFAANAENWRFFKAAAEKLEE